MSVMKYKDPTTGEVKKVGAPKADTYTKTETDALLAKKVNPNLLDNWYFGNPVNQRGISAQNPWPTNQHGIDRWIQYGSGASLENGYVYFPAVVVPTQNLDPNLYNLLLGKVVTFSYLMADNTLVTGTSAVLDGATTMLVNNPDGQAYITSAGGVQFYRNTSFGCVAVKLELGDTQTLAHQDADGNWVLNEIPDYGEQLRRCQRYCVVFGAEGTLYPLPNFSLAWDGQIIVVIPLGISMRVPNPLTAGGGFSATLTGDQSIKYQYFGSEVLSANGVSINQCKSNCVWLNIKNNNSVVKLTSAESGIVYLYGNTSIVISADL